MVKVKKFLLLSEFLDMTFESMRSWYYNNKHRRKFDLCWFGYLSLHKELSDDLEIEYLKTKKELIDKYLIETKNI